MAATCASSWRRADGARSGAYCSRLLVWVSVERAAFDFAHVGPPFGDGEQDVGALAIAQGGMQQRHVLGQGIQAHSLRPIVVAIACGVTTGEYGEPTHTLAVGEGCLGERHGRGCFHGVDGHGLAIQLVCLHICQRPGSQAKGDVIGT